MKEKIKLFYDIRKQVGYRKDGDVVGELWAILRKHEARHGLSLAPVRIIHPEVRDTIMSARESINAYVLNTFPNPTKMPSFGERLRARERS